MRRKRRDVKINAVAGCPFYRRAIAARDKTRDYPELRTREATLRISALVICAALATAGPAAAQTVAAIQKLDDGWSAAFNKGDAAAIAAMYAGDAYVLPPGHDMVKGRAAIEAFWKGATQQLGDAKLVAVDVARLGPRAAREIGTFSFQTKAQPPQPVTGKYVVVWRKLGAHWQLATDIWNTNK
jgi:uncharacterized protein (TIGR02246 family)